MKRIFTALLLLLLLAGCSNQTPTEPVQTGETTVPTATTVATEPPTLLELAQPWDDTGALVQIPLTVPNLWQYTGVRGYQEDLLLWGLDTHNTEEFTMLLCLVDTLTGEVLAQATYKCESFSEPQVLGDTICLCDSNRGQVLLLDGSLQVQNSWQIESGNGSWYMGHNGTLYQFVEYQYLYAVDPDTGKREDVLENARDIIMIQANGDSILMQYTDTQTLKQVFAALDLGDGTVKTQPMDEDFSTMTQYGDIWLGNLNRDSSVYYLLSGSGTQWARREELYPELTPDGRILEQDYQSELRLYDTDGNFLSGCRLSDSGECYLSGSLIPSREFGGYFLLLENYGTKHLLFWDTSKGNSGDDLVFEPLPPESEQMTLLRQRAQELELEYGVEILMGDRCQKEYSDFTVDLTEDYEALLAELDELEAALSAYPAGFFRQLCTYGAQGVRIQLVGTLYPIEGTGRDGGSYAAFTYPGNGKFEVVADIYSTGVYSYYHEFSHNIDKFLEYQADTGEESQYSEENWQTLNPEGFVYSDDYMSEFETLPEEYEAYFIDSYSTVNPTEDRARVMENAMFEYNDWIFADYPGLQAKLRYYCGCIREAFDTTGWPETTMWEQYVTAE